MVPSLNSLENNSQARHTLFSSRDCVILVVLKALTILSVTIISILVATGCFSLTGASIAIPISIFSIWFLGITLLFFINKRELSKFSSFDEKKLIFSQRQKDLIKWGISQKKLFSQTLQESDVSISISVVPYLREFFPKETFSQRVSGFQKDFDNTLKEIFSTMEHAKKNFSGFSDFLKKEFLYLFGPSVKKPDITPKLFPCKDIVENFALTYSLSDILCFCDDNPETWNILSEKIFQSAQQAHIRFIKNRSPTLTLKDSTIYICRLLNTWFLGKTLEEGTLHSLSECKKELLSEELKQALTGGNLCRFIIHKASTKDSDPLVALFKDPEDLDALSAKNNESLSIGIGNLGNKNPKLQTFKNELIQKLSIYNAISTPGSRLYSYHLWKNKDKLLEAYEFIKENSKTILNNPIIVLEIIHNDENLQKFIKEFLQTGFNFEKIKKIIRPIILGGISSRSFTKKDIQLFCNRFNLAEKSFLESVSNGTLLHLLFPKLFEQ
ncbi:CT214 family putative inclusion membrane protein [Chlamydiifrater phoenicopteri]|uniref:CT214 family putative inclusion membrane protein n=1 Tax=Chlamydiifrater phoenicopteri TaxID=2681469 RepID=UPI001BCCB6B1|nr:hypothetical protein [Chlamydiifrater phoenicopteri]